MFFARPPIASAAIFAPVASIHTGGKRGLSEWQTVPSRPMPSSHQQQLYQIRNQMRVCLTGCDGYLGSLLGPQLLRRGFEVLGVDTGFYKERSLYRQDGDAPFTRVKDLRSLEPGDLQGVDAIVHMAELSNDPTGQLAPHITHEINHLGSVRLAEFAKRAGVQRFVYMSSCSVYGVADKDFVDEECPVNPQTAYAECKTLVERDVSGMADAHFSPTFLRNATAYGASPRMRFDIVLNNLCGHAWTSGQIRMTSDGTPWRPLV